MRILILSNLFPPLVRGGYEQACANVAAGLAARGHEIRVLTSFAPAVQQDPPYVNRSLDIHWFLPAALEDAGARALQLHHALCSSFINTRSLIHELRSFAPDLVYVWNLFGIGMGALLDTLNQAGVPWAAHLMDRMPGYLHDSIPAHVRDVFGARGAALWERGAIISMSANLLDEINRECGFSLHESARVIPGWVDLLHAREHHPFKRDGITRFVFAGAIGPHKGVGLIIEAARLLVATHPDFTVDLYGAGDITRYIDLAQAHGVGDRLRFRGPRSQAELFAVYSESDAFLFPTWDREPFGFAPVEAAGCGTPPIMTRGCGASERFVDGVHCVKVDRNAVSLAEAMRAVADGAVNLGRMGRAAAQMVRQDLSFENCLNQIEQVLLGAARGWDQSRLMSSTFEQLAFTKHDLSARLRFGMV